MERWKLVERLTSLDNYFISCLLDNDIDLGAKKSFKDFFKNFMKMKFL